MAILFEMTNDYRELLENEGVVFEGTMQEIKDIKKTKVKRYKALKKEAIAFKKEGKYTNAINALNEAKKILKDIEREANNVSEPEFIDYLKRTLLYWLIVGLIIAAPAAYITVNQAKDGFKKWIKQENDYIDSQISYIKTLK